MNQGDGAPHVRHRLPAAEARPRRVMPMIQVTLQDIRLFYFYRLDKDSNHEPSYPPNDHQHRIAPDRESGL